MLRLAREGRFKPDYGGAPASETYCKERGCASLSNASRFFTLSIGHCAAPGCAPASASSPPAIIVADLSYRCLDEGGIGESVVVGARPRCERRERACARSGRMLWNPALRFL
jgi:hypothetical protein